MSAAETIYAAELAPVFAELDQLRQSVFRRLLISGGIALAIVAVVAVVSVGCLALPALIIAGIAVWWMNRDSLAAYQSQFKEQVVARLVGIIDPTWRYDARQGISESEFRASQIWDTSIDRYACEDLIAGEVGATAFRFSEVHAEYKTQRTDSQGERTTEWHTIARGVFFIGDFNKSFGGRTFVKPDAAESMLGGIGQALQGLTASLSHQGAELVKLEDPDFERLFVVYGTDQIEARYILSTSLMRRLVEFRQTVGSGIWLSFVDSRVHLVISHAGDLFEPPPVWRTKPMDLADAQTYLRDVALARDIIEELNLNLRIWSKQA
jgi:hypothetical protein